MGDGSEIEDGLTNAPPGSSRFDVRSKLRRMSRGFEKGASLKGVLYWRYG